MGLGEGRKRGFAVLAITMGVCLTSSCVSMAPPIPPEGDDWRTLRRIDLPAELVRAAWTEESYLSEGHPVQFGRTSIQLQPSGAARKSIVKATNNASNGLLIDNLTCYNAVRGTGKCALLLDPPNRCYLSVYAKSGASESEPFESSDSFDVSCPAYLTLGR